MIYENSVGVSQIRYHVAADRHMAINVLNVQRVQCGMVITRPSLESNNP